MLAVVKDAFNVCQILYLPDPVLAFTIMRKVIADYCACCAGCSTRRALRLIIGVARNAILKDTMLRWMFKTIEPEGLCVVAEGTGSSVEAGMRSVQRNLDQPAITKLNQVAVRHKVTLNSILLGTLAMRPLETVQKQAGVIAGSTRPSLPACPPNKRRPNGLPKSVGTGAAC